MTLRAVLNKAKCLRFSFNASTAMQKIIACDGFFKVIVPIAIVSIPKWNRGNPVLTLYYYCQPAGLRLLRDTKSFEQGQVFKS